MPAHPSLSHSRASVPSHPPPEPLHGPPPIHHRHRHCRRSLPLRCRPAAPDRRGNRRSKAQARRPDRLRLVRQERPVPAHPGRAGRGRLALRRRSRSSSPRPPRSSSQRQSSKEKRRGCTATTARCSRRRTSTSCSSARPTTGTPCTMIAAVRGRGRRLRAEADQRRRARGRGDARRRPQAQARRAGRHAAQEHAAPDRGARRRSSTPACSARSATSRSAATTTCGPTATRRSQPVPDYLDYEMWTGPAPLRPYDGLPHKRWWRTFTEYGNGIMGDMCVHMLDMVRWMLDLGWPKRVTLHRRHPRAEGGQVEHHRHADRDVRLRRPQRRLAAPHLGHAARPGVPLGAASSTATRARSRPASMRYDFIPHGQEASRSTATASSSTRSTPRT